MRRMFNLKDVSDVGQKFVLFLIYFWKIRMLNYNTVFHNRKNEAKVKDMKVRLISNDKSFGISYNEIRNFQSSTGCSVYVLVVVQRKK